MKARLLLASLFLTCSVFAQNFTNATVTTVDARGGVANAIGRGEGWYAWEAPVADDVNICCWGNGKGNCCGGCELDGNKGWSINISKDDIADGVMGTMIVALKMDAGRVTKVRMLRAGCPVNGRGNAIRWLSNVDPASSIAFLESHARDEDSTVGALANHKHPAAIVALERLAGRDHSGKVREQALFWLGNRGGERGFRFLKDFVHSNESTSLKRKAIFAITQSESEGALPELINLARRDPSKEVRREAIFWLGQKAGSKASSELRRAVDEDPDDDVREHAVFAISQLPHERSVPMLVDLVRNHKSAAVRKKAMFWLAQTGDDRAIEVIEEILMK
jgi:HEAT repeat protein